ncbi:extracellular solute-binding protein, family 7 [Jhaorihella thermophila]|uniref:Extracellular solute-binding protein, family 7 n=1 Tax=Jhaorihella thermophila TaxID=488547 RepID=A0A1H5UTA7_9RHOB|nr:extracellular solute-binding protein, family 7 [Jhaorihella thermophila]
MLRKITGTVLGAVTALTVAAGTAGAAEWRGWNIHVEGYPNTVAMNKFAELVEEKTGGEIKLQMFHGGTLGSQPDAIEQVRLGALEVGNFNLGPIGPVAPEANVVSLPFIFKGVDHMFRVLDGEGGKMIADGMAAKGLLPLSWFDAGARSFYNTAKPINTPEDVKGMKVRVMNNDLYSGMIAQLGGNPSPRSIRRSRPASWTGPKTTGHPMNPPATTRWPATIRCRST